MSKTVYISNYGYLTPEELEKKLKEVSDGYNDRVRIIGRLTLYLETAKQEAMKLGDVLNELIKAKAKLDLEEKEDESHR